MRSLRLLHDLEQIYFEHQGRVRRNRPRHTAAAVSEIGRADQFCPAAHLDSLHTFSPAGNYAAQRKRRRLLATERAVKFLAVGERAAVMHLDGVARLGLGTGALVENGDFESRCSLGRLCMSRPGAGQESGDGGGGKFVHAMVFS